MSVSIGIVAGGWHDSSTNVMEVIRSVMNLVADHREQSPIVDQAEVNVVFQVPGDLLQPEHIGVRTGSISKRDRVMMTQVAIPENVMRSTDPADFIFGAILESLDIVTPHFKNCGWSFSRDDHMTFMKDIERRWRNRQQR